MKQKTKRFFAVLLAIVMVLCSAPLSGLARLKLPDWSITANAADEYVCGKYTYTLSDNKATITDVDSNIKGVVEIPSTLDSYSVVAIGENAFSKCMHITGVIIPDGVEKIDYGAFADCVNLTKAEIPESVKTIESGAFSGCTSLIKVELPPAITEISNSLFSNCTNLTEVTIPDGVKSIGYYAFSNCDTLVSVTLPSEVTTIGDHAFSNCESLTAVTLSDKLTTIGESAFSNCTVLSNITIPESVTNIGYSAFSCCNALESVSLPSAVSNIGSYAFQGCAKLKEIKVDTENKNYLSENGVLFNIDKTTIIQYPIGNGETSYAIPSSVKNIGEGAFYESSLKNITLPEKLKAISDRAFESCSDIEEIIIPVGTETIGVHAFSVCNSLKKITIPDTVTDLGTWTFWFCGSLKEIEIPGSIKSIGDQVFGGSGLEKLTLNSGLETIYNCGLSGEFENIYIPETVTYISDSVFFDVAADNFDVNEKNEYFSNDDFGALFNKDKTILIKYPTNNNRQGYTVPETVVRIKESAFIHCEELTNVTIPDGATNIGANAFEDCTSLIEITIPNTVKNVNFAAFNECNRLADIYYSGTEAEWNAIAISEKNGALRNARIHYNYDETHTYTAERVTEPTCNEWGKMKCVCSCGFSYEKEIPPTRNHIMGEWKTNNPTCTDPGSKYRKCETCWLCESEEIPALGGEHSWDEWTLNRFSCCTDGGEEKRVCSICNGEEFRNIAPTEHDMDEWETTSEPTCGDLGYKTKKCKNCEYYESEEIEPTGEHIFTGWRTHKDPTCTEKGQDYRYCRVCNTYEYKDTEALGGEHSWSEWETGYFSCTDGGYEHRNCSICHDCEERDLDPTGEHVWGDWSDRCFSCTDGGEEYRYCQNCEASDVRYLEVTGEHSWGNWTYYDDYCDDGITEINSCAICDEKDYRTLDPQEHSWGEIELDYEPTCGEEGYGYKTCQLCGYETSVDIEPTGEHVWGSWYTAEKATCTDEGRRARDCEECWYTEYESVPALGGEHDWGEWDLNPDGTIVDEDADYEGSRPTCTEPGERYRWCKNCKTSQSEEIPALDGEHIWSDWKYFYGSCVDGGEETRECSVCERNDYREFEPKSHDWSEWIVDCKATCTEEGQNVRRCKYCYESEYEEIPALGGEHNWGDWITYNKVTCTQWGDEYRDCSACGYREWNDLEPTGHTFGEWIWDETHMNMYRICHCGVAEGSKMEIDKDEDVEIYYPEDPDAGFDIGEITDKNNSKYQLIEEKFGSGIVKVYDINLIDGNGVHVQPKGTVKVKLPHNGKEGTFKVYRLNDDGTYTDMNAYVQGSHIVFITDHFSYYVIVDTEVTDTPDVPENPSEDCTCNCHKGGLATFFFNFILFFQKLFKANQICDCGASHY